MNYNDKDNKQRYNDDFDIKSRLNESLDLNGINVSEELINKTLNAIKASQEEGSSETKNVIHHKGNNEKKGNKGNKGNKIVLWNGYIRRFAGAAAVVLVVVAGFSMMRLVGTGSKKDSSTPKYSQDSATVERKQSNQTSSASQNENGVSEVSPESDRTEALKEDASKEYASSEDASQADNPKVGASKEAESDNVAASGANTDSSTKKSNNITFGASAKKSIGDNETAQKGSGSTSTAKSSVKASKKSEITDEKAFIDQKEMTDQKAIADTTKSDQQSSENAIPKVSADNKENADASTESAPKMALKRSITDESLKFDNICPISPEEISTVKISFVASGTSISITNPSDINDFHTRMEKYQFRQETGDNDSAEYSVVIESSTVSPNLYTVTVGKNISVSYATGEQVTENRYQSTDIEGLKSELNQIVTRNGN